MSEQQRSQLDDEPDKSHSGKHLGRLYQQRRRLEREGEEADVLIKSKLAFRKALGQCLIFATTATSLGQKLH